MPFGLTTLPGNLSRRELAQRYAERSGRDLGDGVFYYVYGLLKIAVIAQQIYARYKAGLTQDRRFATLIYGVQALGEQACRAIDKGRNRRLGPDMSVFSWFRYKAIPWFTSLGLTSGTITLEVSGRKSGKPVRVSLTQVRLGDTRYLVSLGGELQWVSNVRSADGHANSDLKKTRASPSGRSADRSPCTDFARLCQPASVHAFGQAIVPAFLWPRDVSHP